MRFERKIIKLLGEILVEKKIISLEQLNKALELKQKEGGLIGEWIVKLGFAKEEDIAQCIAIQYGLPYLILENYDIPKEAICAIPKTVAEYYCIIPVDKFENILTIAMANPLNEEAIQDLEDLTGCKIKIFVSTVSEVKNAIKKYYP